uniref:Immunoglobulin V-set domain-containing protein n=1 Tax=Astatotilapia calliptera TaxID=8154 RepID=A0A3P8QR66_ASTCA
MLLYMIFDMTKQIIITFLYCLYFTVALRCVISAVGVIHVTGYMGSEVKVSCFYGQGYESYEKYLCKSNCGNGDVLIKTSESRKNKYVIHDDKTARIFTTTIFDLRSVDAGKYWCGVSKFGKDIYTEVDCCDNMTKLESYEGYSESISCPYESQYQNNLKYMCRGNQRSTCRRQALITSHRRQHGRFRLDDDKISGKFTVTINSLTKSDSGSYLCGVQRNSDLDVFSAVDQNETLFSVKVSLIKLNVILKYLEEIVYMTAKLMSLFAPNLLTMDCSF